MKKAFGSMFLALVFLGVSAAPVFAKGVSAPQPACDSIASYKQDASVSSGLAMIKASINLANPCDQSVLTSIMVSLRNESNGELKPFWVGGYNKTYGFTAQYVNAIPGVTYTVIVDTFRTVDGVTTYHQVELPSITAVASNGTLF